MHVLELVDIEMFVFLSKQRRLTAFFVYQQTTSYDPKPNATVLRSSLCKTYQTVSYYHPISKFYSAILQRKKSNVVVLLMLGSRRELFGYLWS